MGHSHFTKIHAFSLLGNFSNPNFINKEINNNGC